MTKPKPKTRTRPVIVFDSNNKLSWADEVMEEEAATQQFPLPTKEATASPRKISHNGSPDSAASSASLSTSSPNKPQDQRQQSTKRKQKHIKNRQTTHSSTTKLGINPTQKHTQQAHPNKFSILKGSVDCT
jgi:hypothetical protein